MGYSSNKFELTPESFGTLKPFVENSDITDVDYNGKALWITYIDGRREHVTDSKVISGLTPAFIQAFCQKVSNSESKGFNKSLNLLEAETPTLRISILHESVNNSGHSICIRKTTKSARLNPKMMIETKFCERAVINLIANCVKAKMNIIVGGEPGAGKTECAKFFTQFIPESERVITIEDNPEWHFGEINPNHDCVEMKINEGFDYAKAIKTCLRQNPKWIMLSEARSSEVKYLIESWSTGVNGITTIHTDSVMNIPSRLLNMMSSRTDSDRLEHDIYDYVNLVLVIRRKSLPDGTQWRYIDQLGFLHHDESGVHPCVTLLIDNGKKVPDVKLPSSIGYKFVRAGITSPFKCDEVDTMLSNLGGI